jgi:hypothetical protein
MGLGAAPRKQGAVRLERKQGRGLTAAPVRTTALLSTAWAARLVVTCQNPTADKSAQNSQNKIEHSRRQKNLSSADTSGQRNAGGFGLGAVALPAVPRQTREVSQTGKQVVDHSACILYLEELGRPQLTGDAPCPSGPRPLVLAPLDLPLWAQGTRKRRPAPRFSI